MTTFVQIDFPAEHPGVVRAERALATLGELGRRRGTASLLGAAIFSALLVVANELVATWTDGHLLAAWVVMWALAFGAAALFVTPRRGAVRSALTRWQARRREAADDRRMWELAMRDARVMADIERAMTRQAELRDPRYY